MTSLKPDDPRALLFCALLDNARRKIYLRKSYYLCDALTEASADITGNPRCDSVMALLDWISEPIMRDDPHGPGTVESWLNQQGVPGDCMSPERMRQYRLQWIDAMIKYFGGGAR